MDKIPFNRFKRNPKHIKSKLKKTDRYILTKDDLYVIFPSRYINANLVEIDNVVKVCGILIIVDDNYNYSLMKIPNWISFTPSNIDDIEIDGVLYKLLNFQKNSIFIDNINIIESEEVLFNIYDEFIIKGNMFAFLPYSEATSLFDYAKKYCGSRVADDNTPLELTTSIISRNKDDLNVLYRNTLKTVKSLDKKPVYTKLLDPYAFPDTLSKISGSYLKKGIDSSIVTPSDDLTTLERVVLE